MEVYQSSTVARGAGGMPGVPLEVKLELAVAGLGKLKKNEILVLLGVAVQLVVCLPQEEVLVWDRSWGPLREKGMCLISLP